MTNSLPNAYYAARYERKAEVLAKAKEASPYINNVARWTWTDEARTLTSLEQVGGEDWADVVYADVLILFTEQHITGKANLWQRLKWAAQLITGRLGVYGRGGCDTEFGIALERGHHIIIVGPRKNVFHQIRRPVDLSLSAWIDQYDTWEEALEAIKNGR